LHRQRAAAGHHLVHGVGPDDGALIRHVETTYPDPAGREAEDEREDRKEVEQATEHRVTQWYEDQADIGSRDQRPPSPRYSGERVGERGERLSRTSLARLLKHPAPLPCPLPRVRGRGRTGLKRPRGSVLCAAFSSRRVPIRTRGIGPVWRGGHIHTVCTCPAWDECVRSFEPTSDSTTASRGRMR